MILELKEKNPAEKTKPPVSSIVLYVAFSVAAILALASLINTIIVYSNNVDQYVKMGYPAAEVTKYLVQTQLLPGIFESIAITGGIAIILLGAGIINHKISKCLMLLNKNEVSNEATKELVQKRTCLPQVRIPQHRRNQQKEIMKMTRIKKTTKITLHSK